MTIFTAVKNLIPGIKFFTCVAIYAPKFSGALILTPAMHTRSKSRSAAPATPARKPVPPVAPGAPARPASRPRTAHDAGDDDADTIVRAKHRLFSARDGPSSPRKRAPDAPRKLSATRSRLSEGDQLPVLPTQIGFAFPRNPLVALQGDEDSSSETSSVDLSDEIGRPDYHEVDDDTYLPNVRNIAVPSPYTAQTHARRADEREFDDVDAARPRRVRGLILQNASFGAVAIPQVPGLTTNQVLSELCCRLDVKQPRTWASIEFQNPATGAWLVQDVSYMYDPPAGAVIDFLCTLHNLPRAGMALYRAGRAMWNVLGRMAGAYGVKEGDTLRYQHSRSYTGQTDTRDTLHVMAVYELADVQYCRVVQATSYMTLRALFDLILEAVSSDKDHLAAYSVDPSLCISFDAVAMMDRTLASCGIENNSVLAFMHRRD